jgi:hypothetical protein
VCVCVCVCVCESISNHGDLWSSNPSLCPLRSTGMGKESEVWPLACIGKLTDAYITNQRATLVLEGPLQLWCLACKPSTALLYHVFPIQLPLRPIASSVRGPSTLLPLPMVMIHGISSPKCHVNPSHVRPSFHPTCQCEQFKPLPQNAPSVCVSMLMA